MEENEIEISNVMFNNRAHMQIENLDKTAENSNTPEQSMLLDMNQHKLTIVKICTMMKCMWTWYENITGKMKGSMEYFNGH